MTEPKLLEPQFLDLASDLAFDLPPEGLAYSTGLHVLVGPNNAGKTRLLRALEKAAFRLSIAPADAGIDTTDWPSHRRLKPGSLPPLVFRWPRGQGEHLRSDGYPPEFLEDLRDDGLAGVVDDAQHLLRKIEIRMQPRVRERAAVYVPTQRFPSHECEINISGHLSNPPSWPALLLSIENAEDRREIECFRAVDDAFAAVTEGLRIRIAVAGANKSRIQIMVYSANQTDERPLSECGDGLRDLLGVLLYVALKPDADLLLDEPGLRLHPGAQRRLLKHLDAQSSDRAIWMATHDAAFVGAAVVRTRYHVTRRLDTPGNRVTPLLDQAALEQLRADLGWLPADAFLAERILLCEGPSDRLVFERVLGWLARGDVSLGGTVVSELGGCGIVWGASTELSERLQLVRRVAPFAAHTVLLDRDGRPDPEVEALVARIKNKGFAVWMLPDVQELEDYWLQDLSLVEAITRGLASDASAIRREDIPAPSIETIADFWNQREGGNRKGSAILEDLCERQLKLRFDKVASARHAMAFLDPKASHEVRSSLTKAVSEALAKGQRQA